MKKIEAIIRPGKLEDVKMALEKYNVNGMTVTPIMGCGKQKGHEEYYRGTVLHTRFLEKVKIEIVTKNEFADEIIELICNAARTGEIGDGKIFITDISEAIRIRTGDKGETAL